MADDARPVHASTTRVEVSSTRERRFSVSEFRKLEEVGILGDEGGYELRDGRVTMAPVPGSSHSILDGRLVGLLTVELARLGKLRTPYQIAANVGVLLNDATLLGVDVAVVQQTEEDAQRTYFRLDAFCLCVETAINSLADDLGEKRTRYAAAEIPEYWVIDVAAKTVHVFTAPSRGDYTQHTEKKAGDTLHPLFEPEITIAVDDLF